MTDEWRGVSQDEYVIDQKLSEQDWADWRAARGFEPDRRPTREEMVERMAAERREYERQQLEGVAERAVIHDGWATGYPAELRAAEPKERTMTAVEDYPNFALWAQHGPQGLQSDTGKEIIRALHEIDRLRNTVDMLRSEITRRGVDPDSLTYPPIADERGVA